MKIKRWMTMGMVIALFAMPLQAKEIFKFGKSVTLDSTQKADTIVVFWGDATIDGKVDSSVIVVGGDITLGPKAEVDDDVIAFGGEVSHENTSRIGGETVEVTLPDEFQEFTIPEQFQMSDFTPLLVLGSAIVSVLSIAATLGMVILSVVIAILFREPIRSMSDEVHRAPLHMLLWGIVGKVLIVPVGIMLLFSVVGIALIPVEIAFVVIAMLLGYVVAAQVVGQRVLAQFKKELSIVWQVVVGLLVFWAVGFIPFLGWLFKAVATLIGFGSVLAITWKAVTKKSNVKVV